MKTRQLNEDLFEFAKKLLENDEVQAIGMKLDESKFVNLFNRFHSKKPIPKQVAAPLTEKEEELKDYNRQVNAIRYPKK